MTLCIGAAITVLDKAKEHCVETAWHISQSFEAETTLAGGFRSVLGTKGSLLLISPRLPWQATNVK